jgi:hypothetical protein
MFHLQEKELKTLSTAYTPQHHVRLNPRKIKGNLQKFEPPKTWEIRFFNLKELTQQGVNRLLVVLSVYSGWWRAWRLVVDSSRRVSRFWRRMDEEETPAPREPPARLPMVSAKDDGCYIARESPVRHAASWFGRIACHDPWRSPRSLSIVYVVSIWPVPCKIMFEEKPTGSRIVLCTMSYVLDFY